MLNWTPSGCLCFCIGSLRKPHGESKKGGFTLIESLISIVLLSIVLLAGMAFYFNATELQTTAMHKKIATELVNSRMEELRNGPYSDLPHPAIPPELMEDLDIAIGGLSARRKVTVTGIDDNGDGLIDDKDYKQVEVKATWTDTGKSKARELRVVTFITP